MVKWCLSSFALLRTLCRQMKTLQYSPKFQLIFGGHSLKLAFTSIGNLRSISNAHQSKIRQKHENGALCLTFWSFWPDLKYRVVDNAKRYRICHCCCHNPHHLVSRPLNLLPPTPTRLPQKNVYMLALVFHFIVFIFFLHKRFVQFYLKQTTFQCFWMFRVSSSVEPAANCSSDSVWNIGTSGQPVCFQMIFHMQSGQHCFLMKFVYGHVRIPNHTVCVCGTTNGKMFLKAWWLY